MTTQEHTPFELGFQDNQNIYRGHKRIASVYCEEKDWKDTAAFIVRACNAHDELVRALEWCQTVYGEDWPESASIRRLIKEAKGKE